MIDIRPDEPAPPLKCSIHGITFSSIGKGQGGAPSGGLPRSFIDPMREKGSSIGSFTISGHQWGENYENVVLGVLVHPDAHGRLCLRLFCWEEAGEPGRDFRLLE